jgi:hypothetical protein
LPIGDPQGERIIDVGLTGMRGEVLPAALA